MADCKRKTPITAIKTVTKMKVCVFCRHVRAHYSVIKAELCYYYYFMQHYKVTEVQCLIVDSFSRPEEHRQARPGPTALHGSHLPAGNPQSQGSTCITSRTSSARSRTPHLLSLQRALAFPPSSCYIAETTSCASDAIPCSTNIVPGVPLDVKS